MEDNIEKHVFANTHSVYLQADPHPEGPASGSPSTLPNLQGCAPLAGLSLPKEPLQHLPGAQPPSLQRLPGPGEHLSLVASLGPVGQVPWALLPAPCSQQPQSGPVARPTQVIRPGPPAPAPRPPPAAPGSEGGRSPGQRIRQGRMVSSSPGRTHPRPVCAAREQAARQRGAVEGVLPETGFHAPPTPRNTHHTHRTHHAHTHPGAVSLRLPVLCISSPAVRGEELLSASASPDGAPSLREIRCSARSGGQKRNDPGQKGVPATSGGHHRNPRAVSWGAACLSHTELGLFRESPVETGARGGAHAVLRPGLWAVCGGTAGLLHPVEQWPSASLRVSSAPVPVLLQVTSHSSGRNSRCCLLLHPTSSREGPRARRHGSEVSLENEFGLD